jgi:hypothetical protein
MGKEVMVEVESIHRKNGMAYRLEVTGWVDEEFKSCEEYREEWSEEVKEPIEEEQIDFEGGGEEPSPPPSQQLDLDETLDQDLYRILTSPQIGEQEELSDDNHEMPFGMDEEEDKYSWTDDTPAGVQNDAEDKEESPMVVKEEKKFEEDEISDIDDLVEYSMFAEEGQGLFDGFDEESKKIHWEPSEYRGERYEYRESLEEFLTETSLEGEDEDTIRDDGSYNKMIASIDKEERQRERLRYVHY